MDNELDFRVGDVVCDLRYGDGVIKNHHDLDYPILVAFSSGMEASYTPEGRVHRRETFPTLRHGTYEQNFGNLPNLKPKRKVKRWVNRDTNGEWALYDSKEKAQKFLGINPSKSVAVAVEIEVDE